MGEPLRLVRSEPPLSETKVEVAERNLILELLGEHVFHRVNGRCSCGEAIVGGRFMEHVVEVAVMATVEAYPDPSVVGSGGVSPGYEEAYERGWRDGRNLG